MIARGSLLFLLVLAALPAHAEDAEAPTVPVVAPGSGDAAPTVPVAAPAEPHVTELEIRRRPAVLPGDYPDAARAQHLPAEKCAVRLSVDEKGVPFQATASCNPVFAASAEAIALRYRFYPVKLDGKPAKVAFDLTVVIRPPE